MCNRVLLTMPGYLKEDKSLGCKIVTYFGDNPSRGLKTILASIFLFNSTTGQLQAVSFMIYVTQNYFLF